MKYGKKGGVIQAGINFKKLIQKLEIFFGEESVQQSRKIFWREN